MRLATTVTTMMVLAAVLAPAARADWFLGDPHKMHYPQLPDPMGWDVRISNARRLPGEPPQWVVADDWLCSQSGPVSDVHLWVSWMEDRQDQILNLHLSIHDDVPANTPGPDGRILPYSRPGHLLWDRDFAPVAFTLRPAGTGEQGWFDPPFEEWFRPDHLQYFQINVTGIPDPFIQERGKIYWLDVSADLWGEGEIGKLGWKTSLEHWNDDAVYWSPITNQWHELRDPITRESLDMAFVITPEPATLALVGLGAAAVLARRRRR